MGSETQPVAHLYALVWNERPLLPFFFEHYRDFVDRFFLFDDGSDDGSAEYLAAQPDVTLGSFVNTGDSYVEAAQAFYNSAWKASRGDADWVIVVNVDELIHHHDSRAALARMKAAGVTVARTRGWEMVSDRFPTSGPLVDTVPSGLRDPEFDKVAIWNPSAIQAMKFGPGRHAACPEGVVTWAPDGAFELLHMKSLGADYLTRRYAELDGRRKARDRERRFANRYAASPDVIRRDHAQRLALARPVLERHAARQGLVREVAPGCKVVSLQGSRNERGGLQEIWRHDLPWLPPVTQVYSTLTLPGVAKAWYRHRSQTDQITVLSGAVRLVLIDSRDGPAAPVEIDLDAGRPEIVSIAPGVWHGFQAVGGAPATLLHLNDRPFYHLRPDEDRLPPDDPGFAYRWPG